MKKHIVLFALLIGLVACSPGIEPQSSQGSQPVSTTTAENSSRSVPMATSENSSQPASINTSGGDSSSEPATYDEDDDRFLYGSDNSIIGIKGEFKKLERLDIPSSYRGKPITKISAWAFYGNDFLKYVFLPKTIVSIGNQAFSTCANLKEVDVEKGSRLATVEDNAFSYCSSLKHADFLQTVSTVGNQVFWGCQSLCSVSLSNTLPAILDRTFYQCYSLYQITIPTSVLVIGNEAFRDCYNLVEIINESSLEISKGSESNGSIGKHAFDMIQNKSDSKIRVSDGFVIYENEEDACLVTYIGNGRSLSLPSGITKIKDYAFYGQRTELNGVHFLPSPFSATNDIHISDGVRSIGSYAFYGCDGLTQVFIPESLKEIGESVFYNISSKLTEIINRSPIRIYYAKRTIDTVDDTKITVTDGGFVIDQSSGYSELISYIGESKDVIIPSDVRAIGEYCFASCAFVETISVPNEVGIVKEYAFQGCSCLREIRLSESITTIPNGAFFHCISLDKIVIPDNVATIGINAFKNCVSLKEIALSEGTRLSSIGGCAFQRCISLKSVFLPDSVCSIDNMAFLTCSSLESISVGENNDCFRSVSGVLYDNALTTLLAFPAAKEFVKEEIPATVHIVGERSFSGCNSFEVSIPSCIDEIDDYAFFGSEIKRIVIPTSIKKIGYWSFLGMQSYANEVDYEYSGTMEEWGKITLNSSFDKASYNYTTIHCIDGDIEY